MRFASLFLLAAVLLVPAIMAQKGHIHCASKQDILVMNNNWTKILCPFECSRVNEQTSSDCIVDSNYTDTDVCVFIQQNGHFASGCVSLAHINSFWPKTFVDPQKSDSQEGWKYGFWVAFIWAVVATSALIFVLIRQCLQRNQRVPTTPQVFHLGPVTGKVVKDAAENSQK